MTPAARWWVEHASWFLATELVRRHPACSVVHVRSADGQSDRIWIGGWTGAASSPVFVQRWALDRLGGTLHVGREMRLVATEPWFEIVRDDPTALVDLLEEAAGFPVTVDPRPPSARTLTYQVICRLQAVTVMTPDRIVGRSVVVDEAGTGRLDAPAEYQGVIAALAPGGAPAEAYRFWVLEQRGRPAALLHDSGLAWIGGAQHDLAALFHAHGRLHPVVHAVFGDLLT
ncbi:hypothetical protein [Antribacter gilvus]|uniref:TY-Chap2 family putative peptide chaperone n=1 Tax=Antribacter gilvus TaxID=2304675 RepID=UPI000F786E15|nr:hypothetical protein [Antribacter gilvus]